MPELPEVETIRRGLLTFMVGMTITNLEIRCTHLRYAFPINFSERVKNKKIINISRRAKYLLINLEQNLSIVIHFGMSGSFIVEKDGLEKTDQTRAKNSKHDHVILYLEKEALLYRVIYNDPRRFGFMDLVVSSLVNEYPSFVNLGPEPLEDSFNVFHLEKYFTGRKGKLKTALLNQKLVAGLGNIYVCEALWRAGLSPMRTMKTLVNNNTTPDSKLFILQKAIHNVISEAIEAGGSSLRDYIQVNGSLGSFQNCFYVYNREGKPCLSNCGTLIRRTMQAGRSTFYCEVCQN
ncbi:Formamidopyrimidine-DNA glycosylase [Liberibacter crescens BT-1]|uniref:Formamidopyrimidine-DNA glycosylase n=1 Tax=Liberibacter crescens (strain BT-1) TaxID=1215343 RepID=L0EW45_LIBCB|nr:bifunctional DNA-formamidopyrimidine glycosylase/DNA-(apurinic or apyrimidinic site) lyase [Liberibacter crescens]AGA65182.1 Formamidopyrimidine-DNA glycosylase [Liberibacter crescens BT-1]AMC13139.1 5-hydroxymethyluracil DNA glycosylase [Liberibacter crescens]